MPASRLRPIIPHLRRTVLRQDEAARTDGRLLEQFVATRDAAAFEALVRRHGPMVLGVCRRVVGNLHDAEDAFQATFLVLARKAASVSPREAVGNWLYGVAHTTALRARAANARRRARERQVPDMPQPEAARPGLLDDLLPLLDQELARLPDKYRLAIVLCDLEGRTRRDVARQLRVPEGTLSSRLTTARRMLAKRLARHGLGVTGAGLAAALSPQNASACVPASLTAGAVKAASLLATGQAAAAGAVSAEVATLTEGVLKTMFLNKLKTVTAVVTAAVLACCGLGALTREAAGQSEPSRPARAREGKPSLAHAAADRESLQGVWALVSGRMDGETEVPPKTLLLVNGNRACWLTEDKEMQGGLYLDPTSSPKAFDFAATARTLEGIYELDGDTLRLCYDASSEPRRPRRFATPPGSSHVLMVLKRKKKYLDVSDYRRADGSSAFNGYVERPVPPQPPPRIVPSPAPQAQPASAVPPEAPVYSPAPTPAPQAQPVPREEARAPVRIGEILIVGNVKTPDAVIRKQLRLFPGQVLDYRALRAAEKSLVQLNRFVVDPQKGLRPTVTVLEPRTADAPFKDILVTVQEALTGGAAPKSLRPQVRQLQAAVEQLAGRLLQVNDPGTRAALQQQAGELRDGLKRLEKSLPEDESRSATPINGLNSDGGLTGNLVLNERNFDMSRAIEAQQAAKDLQVAEYYRQVGHAGPARFYYELVCRRYPGTAFAALARQRLNHLKAPGD